MLLIPPITLVSLWHNCVLLSQRVRVFNHNYILHWSKGRNPFSHCLWLYFIALSLQSITRRLIPPCAPSCGICSRLQMWTSVPAPSCQPIDYFTTHFYVSAFPKTHLLIPFSVWSHLLCLWMFLSTHLALHFFFTPHHSFLHVEPPLLYYFVS